MKFVTCLHRPAPPHYPDPLDPVPGQPLYRLLSDIRFPEDVDITQEYPCNIKRYVALADDSDGVSRFQIRVQPRVLGEAIVPTDKLPGGEHPVERLAWDSQGSILGRSVGKGHGVVVPEEGTQVNMAVIRPGFVVANRHIAVKRKIRGSRNLLKFFLAVLQPRDNMISCSIRCSRNP